MIELNNIIKVYKSKKKNSHKALNEINLFLPDNGLVFIIGKSGSGKSTLLNLIGGLDSITSGNIIVDGNDNIPFDTPFKYIVKGDAKSQTIAAASISTAYRLRRSRRRSSAAVPRSSLRLSCAA